MQLRMEEPALVDLYPIERRILQEELDFLDQFPYMVQKPVIIDPTHPVDPRNGVQKRSVIDMVNAVQPKNGITQNRNIIDTTNVGSPRNGISQNVQTRSMIDETDPVDPSERLPYMVQRQGIIDPTEPVIPWDFNHNSGQEVQRISVITNLPTLLKENNAECMQRVVPKVREVLHVAQAEMQLAASSAFLQILQKELVPLQSYTQTFLQTILNSIDSKDPDIASVWLDTLLDVIDLLPKDVLKKEILPMAISKGQLSQPVQSRLSCCRVLGKIATRFEPFVIKKEILPVVQSLCQDIEYEVRGYMCHQLDPVARGLGLEATKSAILPELVELTNDEESYVRLAGLETVVNILSLLDDDTCTSTIVPLVFKFCQQSMQNDDCTLPMVAKHIGKLCHSLSINLTEEQKEWFVELYRKLCRRGISNKKNNKTEENDSSNKVPEIPDLYEEECHIECRRNAAFNMPAMVLFVGARQFKTELYNTFSSLCHDSSETVKKTMACGFHEVAKLLGSNVSVIQSDLVSLLKEDTVEVIKGLVTNIPETLEILAKGGGSIITEAKMNNMSELIPAVLVCETVIASSNDWRLQEEILLKFSCLPRVFTSDQLYFKFIPLMFKKLLSSRAIPVRIAAIRTTLVLLRNTRKLEQRQEIICRLVEEFCHGKSCRNRNLFIDMCKIAIELYSKNFFKEYFFEFLLELSTDPVPNIRLRLCAVLPTLKSLLKLPSDRNLLQQLDSCVRRLLINERDRDVTAAIKTAVEELDKTQVQMESLHRRSYVEDDAADIKKEEEEKLLLELEERERKEDDGRPPKGDKRKDTNASKKDSSTRIPARKGSKIPAATTTTSKDKLNHNNNKDKTAGDTKKEPKKSNSSCTSNIPNANCSKGNVAKSKTITNRSLGSPSSPLPSHRMSPINSAGSSSSSRKSSASSQGSIPSPVNSAGRRRSLTNSPNSPGPPNSAEGNKKISSTRKASLGSNTVSSLPTNSRRKTSTPK